MTRVRDVLVEFVGDPTVGLKTLVHDSVGRALKKKGLIFGVTQKRTARAIAAEYRVLKLFFVKIGKDVMFTVVETTENALTVEIASQAHGIMHVFLVRFGVERKNRIE